MRLALVYLQLCLRSCLCKVKTRLYASTHVKKKKMTLNILIIREILLRVYGQRQTANDRLLLVVKARKLSYSSLFLCF